MASSLLAVAMGKVFRTALNGQCKNHEDLVASVLDLTIGLPAVPGEPDLLLRLFNPMGWIVTADPIALDETRPDWGDAPLATLTLSSTIRLADALNHLYVLLPVLDGAKHYWVGDDEVEKLVRAGPGWLATHPERELISHRYLAHQRGLREAAIQRLVELDDRPVDEAAVEDDTAAVTPLRRLRHDAALDVVCEVGPSSVVDLGCGQGALLGQLLEIQGIDLVIGIEISDTALSKAGKRLHVDGMTERQAARLPAVAGNVFGSMRPRVVVVTTPNIEHNVRYERVLDNGLRHPDHRFEWTRDQFSAWTSLVCTTHGYAVDVRPVGDDDDPQVGPPTQMAVFTRLTDEEGAA